MNALKTLVAVLFFIVLGFAAERVKVSLNHYLHYSAQINGFNTLSPQERETALAERAAVVPYDYYYNHKRISLYHRFSVEQLTAFKWIFALVLAGVYLIAALVFLGWMDAHPAAKNLTYIYVAAALGIAVFFFAVSRIHPNPKAAYAVARKILGFVHSPLPLILAMFTAKMRAAFS